MTIKQATSIKLTTTVGHFFLCDLDFANVYGLTIFFVCVEFGGVFKVIILALLVDNTIIISSSDALLFTFKFLFFAFTAFQSKLSIEKGLYVLKDLSSVIV